MLEPIATTVQSLLQSARDGVLAYTDFFLRARTLLQDSWPIQWLAQSALPVLGWLRLGWNIQPLLVLGILFVVSVTCYVSWKMFGPLLVTFLRLLSLLLPPARHLLRAAPASLFWFVLFYSLLSFPFFQSWLPQGLFSQQQQVNDAVAATADVVLAGPAGALPGQGHWLQILDPLGRQRWAWMPAVPPG
jgi:hypothetical protein